MPQTPPWIQPADPLRATVEGYHTGMQLGAHEAAQRFQEQQQLEQQQRHAQQQAEWEAQFGLQARESARKFEAMQRYQRRLAAGEDPMKVILEEGPAMGHQSSVEAAVIRAQSQKPQRTWSVVDYPDIGKALVPSDGGMPHFTVKPPRPMATFEPATQGGLSGQINTLTKQFHPFPADAQAGYLNSEQRDELRRLEKEQDRITKLQDEDSSGSRVAEMDPKDLEALPASDRANMLKKGNAYKARQQQILDMEQKIKAIRGGSKAGRYHFDPVTGDLKPY